MVDGFPSGCFWQGSRESQTYFWTTEVGTSWRPLRLREGRTHLGSMKSFNQACSEFSSSTCLIVAERTRANEGLDFFGTNRNVGRVS